MYISAPIFPKEKLLTLGLHHSDTVHYQLAPDELVQQALRRRQGVLSDSGALVFETGEFTGRSPKDKFIVKDSVTAGTVDWNDFNQPLDEEYFPVILNRITAYLGRVPEIWVRDCQACADPRYRMNIRVITENPVMSLFAHNMFLRPTEEEIESFRPEWQILCAPNLQLDPEACGVRQHNAVVVSFRNKMILIAGTGYTGEIKKSIFGILNYILPQQKNVLSMHCSANLGKKGDSAIFFGLSGTGKTTLSTEPDRRLIGDDEHGWSADGIFNFEGGCYAKCINLSEDKEPEIYDAIREGSLVENVKFFPGTKTINFDNGSITENTRVSYPLSYIRHALEPSVAGDPKNIFFLTCDAYGVLPPLARLTPEQAMYQFISGYTAKIAGTETGIKDPKLTFSTCFGAPFMPLHPGKYAEMLGKKIRESRAKVWLVNTGWTGGPYLVGSRIRLSHTRALVSAALDGKLDEATYTSHPVFRISMPVACPGVPTEMLDPVNTWSDKGAYFQQATLLARKFSENFERYRKGVSPEILSAAPAF